MINQKDQLLLYKMNDQSFNGLLVLLPASFLTCIETPKLFPSSILGIFNSIHNFNWVNKIVHFTAPLHTHTYR